jgi:hypothetical protein
MSRSRQRGRDSDNRGCHRFQIDTSAGDITGHLFGVKARSTRPTLHATAVTVLARRLSREQPEGPFVMNRSKETNSVLTPAPSGWH